MTSFFHSTTPTVLDESQVKLCDDTRPSNAPVDANVENSEGVLKTTGYPTLPFDSLFLNNNEQDISNIIKNMENVVYDKGDDSKIAKTFNFELKAKE